MSDGLRPVGVIARYVMLGAALGAVSGLLWIWWAPRVQVRSVSDGDFVEAYPEGFAAADLTLAGVLVVVGLLLGGLAVARLRATGFSRGWGQVVGVIAGGATAGVTARVIGWWLAGTSVVKTPEGTFELPLSLRAPGVMLVGAFSGLLVVIFASLIIGDPEDS